MVRIWNKKETQAFISCLRSAGYEVNKVPNGYASKLTSVVDGKPLFKAMQGTRGYLVRVNDDLLTEYA